MPLEFPFTAKDIILGGLIPATVAVAIGLLSAKYLTRESSRSHAANWAIAIAFFLGIRLLALTPWKPVNHWHWLPYIGLACAFLSPLTVHRNVVIRCASALIVTYASAFLLIPDWDDLPASRATTIFVLAGAEFVLWILLTPLVPKSDSRILFPVLSASLIGAAAILSLAGSLRFGQIGGCLAAGFLGFAIAQFLNRKAESLPDVTLSFVVIGCGELFVGYLNLDSSSDTSVPAICFLLPPLAPVSLWLASTVKPLAALPRGLRICAAIAIAACIILFAVMRAIAVQVSWTTVM